MCQDPAYNEYARKPEKPEESLKHSKTFNSNQTTDQLQIQPFAVNYSVYMLQLPREVFVI